MTSKTIFSIGIIIILAILTYLIYPRIRVYFVVDSCLDHGGRWDYQTGHCNTQIELKESHTTFTQKVNTIEFPCAVFIRPNFKKIDKLRKENAVDYNTIVDDNEYYMAISGEYLDSLKLRRIEVESKGSITFKTTQGTMFKVELDSIYWGIILFNGKSKPKEADITFINSDYDTYMIK